MNCTGSLGLYINGLGSRDLPITAASMTWPFHTQQQMRNWQMCIEICGVFPTKCPLQNYHNNTVKHSRHAVTLSDRTVHTLRRRRARTTILLRMIRRQERRTQSQIRCLVILAAVRRIQIRSAPSSQTTSNITATLMQNICPHGLTLRCLLQTTGRQYSPAPSAWSTAG